MIKRIVVLPRHLVVLLLRAYRVLISPLYGPTCRFYPSCSEYALIAVDRHGVIRGGGLAAWRLLRCNPWNPGGVDLVPPDRHDHTHRPARPAEPGEQTPAAGTTPAPSSFRRVA